MMWYQKLKVKLEGYGFEFNPYDAFACNMIVNNKQQPVRYYIDDILSSSVDPKVNGGFHEWLETPFGELKKRTVSR